jgi:hypothetical protein
MSRFVHHTKYTKDVCERPPRPPPPLFVWGTLTQMVSCGACYVYSIFTLRLLTTRFKRASLLWLAAVLFPQAEDTLLPGWGGGGLYPNLVLMYPDWNSWIRNVFILIRIRGSGPLDYDYESCSFLH